MYLLPGAACCASFVVTSNVKGAPFSFIPRQLESIASPRVFENRTEETRPDFAVAANMSVEDSE